MGYNKKSYFNIRWVAVHNKAKSNLSANHQPALIRQPSFRSEERQAINLRQPALDRQRSFRQKDRRNGLLQTVDLQTVCLYFNNAALRMLAQGMSADGLQIDLSQQPAPEESMIVKLLVSPDWVIF